MKEFGDGREWDTEGDQGVHERTFFRMKAAETGHFCKESLTKTPSSLGGGA